MFSKKSTDSNISPEQHAELEYAQKRIKQKKILYRHIVVYLMGAVFLFLFNKILKYGEEYDWYLWAIILWGFMLCLHIYNVFITQKFMGPDWERNQREKLVTKQKEKIAKLQKEIEEQFPMSQYNKKKDTWDESP